MVELSPALRLEYPFTNRFFKLKNGHQVHYIDEGKGEQVLLCLHGNPTWSFYFRGVIKALRPSMRVIAIDHLGCGLSDKPQDFPYRLENHIEHVHELLTYLKIDSFTLLVHDWGGAIGFGLALKRLKQVDKIIITNTAAFLSPDIPMRIALLKYTGVFGKLLIKTCNLFAWPATFMATNKGLSKIAKEGLLLPYQNSHDRVAIWGFVQDIPLSEKHPSYSTLKKIEDGLSRIRGKKLLLWGEKDFCFNMGFFHKWKTIYPHAKTCILSDASHYVLEDAPHVAVSRIKDFLEIS